MASLFPVMQVWPSSGLTFPWAEYVPDPRQSSMEGSAGPDGVGMAMTIWLPWANLGDALQQILGYSYRDTSSGTSVLRRKLPWQNPYTNQMWVKNISSFRGRQLKDLAINLGQAIGGVGSGSPGNAGPGATYAFAEMTIHFWRPPYYVRTDKDILDGSGKPQEWLRYVDRNWQIGTQMLSREGQTFIWATNGGQSIGGVGFPGSVGQKITKFGVSRRWYEIPEACLFSTTSDSTPQGLPTNLVYIQTDTRNPITNYLYKALDGGGNRISPIGGCVNTPVGGGPHQGSAPWVTDNDATKRLFGCRMGTLLYTGAELIPRPLQLPPFLMQIPEFANNEAISQQQYDVVMHFEIFDPPRSQATGGAPSEYRGYNCMPYSRNGLWYAVTSQGGFDDSAPPTAGTAGHELMTAFMYADLSDLFQVL